MGHSPYDLRMSTSQPKQIGLPPVTAQTVIARQVASAAFEKCAEALPYFDELVTALAMCQETQRVASLAHNLTALRRELVVIEKHALHPRPTNGMLNPKLWSSPPSQ